MTWNSVMQEPMSSSGGVARPHQRPSVSSVVEAAWGEPFPLQEYEVPAFPVDVLSPWQIAWVKANAVEMEIPDALAAIPTLAMVSAVSAKLFRVWATANYSEPLNEWYICAVESGTMKTEILRRAVAPLRAYDADRRKQAMEQYHIDEAILDSRKRAKEEASKALSKLSPGSPDWAQADEALRRTAIELANSKKPVIPSLTCDSITPEAIVTKMVDNDGKIAVVSDEGKFIDMIGGQYDKKGKPNFDVVLSAYSGADVQEDRISRGPSFLKNPALTAFVSAQPARLQDLMKIPNAIERGLIARWLIALPKSNVGFRKLDGPPAPQEVQAFYEACIRKLLSIEPTRDEMGQIVPTKLTLSPEAAALFSEFRKDLEPDLRPETGNLSPIIDWANKAHGHLLRLAGILHISDFAGSADLKPSNVIESETILRAWSLIDFFVPNVRAAYGNHGAGPALSKALRIARWLTREKLASFKTAEAHKALGGRFEKKELEDPLEILEMHNYIRPADTPEQDGRPRKPGRPPSQTFNVNPQVHALSRATCDRHNRNGKAEVPHDE